MHGVRSVQVFGAVEGIVDEAVLRRFSDSFDFPLVAVHGKQGKDHLRRSMRAYNRDAGFHRWIVLVDLDHDEECAPPLVHSWVSRRSSHLLFRVAVRAVESWLLADRERIARFFFVPEARVPANPDLLDDPKREMVNLARRSRSSTIRDEMVPAQGSKRSVGPAYTSRLIEFVTDAEKGWRPEIAAKNSDSLRRCLERIAEMKKKLQ